MPPESRGALQSAAQQTPRSLDVPDKDAPLGTLG